MYSKRCRAFQVYSTRVLPTPPWSHFENLCAGTGVTCFKKIYLLSITASFCRSKRIMEDGFFSLVTSDSVSLRRPLKEIAPTSEIFSKCEILGGACPGTFGKSSHFAVIFTQARQGLARMLEA